MSSKKKKILSALLASSMLVSQVSIVAYAENAPLEAPTIDAVAYGTTLSEIRLPENWAWKDDGSTVPDVVNSGYTAVYTVPKGERESYASYEDYDSVNYTVERIVSITVNKVDAAATTDPAKVDNLSFTGSAQNLITGGTTSDGEFQYSLDGENYSTAIPQGTDAKDYTVYYKIVGDSNHNDTTPATIDVSIAKAEITEIAVSDVEVPTGGSTLDTEATAGDTTYNLSAVSWEPNETAGYNKSYTATVTATPDANHVFADSVSITFNGSEVAAENYSKDENGVYTITKAFTTETKKISSITVTDITAPTTGATPDKEITLTDSADFKAPVVEWYAGGTALDGNFAPNTAYTVKITLTPSDNCEFTTETITATINEESAKVEDGTDGAKVISYTFAKTGKATPVVTAPTVSNKLTYGDKLSTATLSEGWSWADGEEVPTVNNSGFTATKTVDDYENYDYAAFAAANEGYTYDSESKKLSTTVAVTVNPKEIEIDIETSADEFTYTGDEKKFETVTVKEKDNAENTLTENTDYTISYENNINAGDNTATLTVTAAENGNYTFTGTTTQSFSIAQATPTVNVTADQKIVKSTGKFTAPTANVPGKFTYTYNGKVYPNEANAILALETAIKEAGSGTISYGFTPDDANYKYVTDTINFTVVDLTFYVGENEVNGETPAVTVKDATYGDTWDSIIQVNVNGAKIGDTAAQEGATFTLDVSGKPNAGIQTYNVLFNGTIGKVKYTNIVVATGKVNVAKKELEVAKNTFKVTKEYDGTKSKGAASGELTVTGLVSPDESPVTYEIPDFESANVGKGTLALTLSVPEDSNYTLTNNTVDVDYEITAKSITPTVEEIAEQTYTGSAITPEVVVKDGETVLTKDKDYTVEYSNNTNKGTATVTIKAAENGNYSFSDKPVNFTIAAAKVTPTVAAIEAQTYTGAAITPDVTVTVGETKLVKDTDYTVNYANNTNAGTATVTITAAGNYAFDEKTVEFTINPKKVETLTIEVTSSNTYTGSAITPTFTVKDVETALAASDYVATISDNINAGTGKITITKKSGGNFTFAETTADFTIAKAASLSVADTNVYFKTDVTGEQTVQLVLPESVGAVVYTGESTKVEITSNEDTVIAADSASISADGVKFTLGTNTENSGKTATITATLVTSNYDAVTANVVVTINENENQEAPTNCKLTFTESGGKYTAEIAAVDGAEYSFDGKTFSSTRTKADIEPNTVVTAYIRLAAKEGFNASPVATVTATTPALKAATPTITAGTTFTESQEVTISCTTEGAEIYYTTDGTAPTASNGTKYTGAFTVTATTTVKAIAIKSGYTNSDVVSATYTKKSSKPTNPGNTGGGGGGSSSGGSSSTTKNPTVDGKTQTWTDVAKDISKLTEGKTETIDLNGGTTVPVDVVKAIATSNAEVTLKVDNVFSWTIDGSDIEAKDAKAANLSITKTTVTGTSALRGIVGTGFSIKGTNVKSELNINFKATHAGEFANLFKKVDGKLVFVDNVKVDKNGAAIGLEVSEKGEYVVMLGKYSDRAGDMDNDGIINAKDSLAILKNFLEIENGVNPLVADVNGDGYINAKDALEVLIEYLNLK